MKQNELSSELCIKELVKEMYMAELEDLNLESEDKYSFSSEFKQKINKLIYNTEKKEKRKNIYKLITAIAASVIILYTILKPEYLAAAYQNFIQWFDKYVEFSGNGWNSGKIPRYYLSYIPESLRHDEKSGYYDTFGYVDINSEVYFSYRRSDGTLNVTTNETAMLTITADDGICVIYLKSNNEAYPSSIVWYSQDEKIIFSITGHLSQEELMKMYYGVKKY